MDEHDFVHIYITAFTSNHTTTRFITLKIKKQKVSTAQGLIFAVINQSFR